MAENQQLILDKFQEHLQATFQGFCERHQLSNSTQSLITFLIDKNLISSVNIKRFTVTREFEELYQRKQMQKSSAINALSDKFNIPERTIWSILKKKE